MFRSVPTLARVATCAAAIAAGGCSTIELVYDNAAWYVRQRADSVFSLDREQERRLRAQLLEIERWHRREELPRYATSLGRLAQDVADGLTRAELERVTRDLEQARQRLLPRLLPAMSALLASLSPAQVNDYDAAIREEIEEDREVLDLSPAERTERRFERTRERTEDWVGELDRTQLARLRHLVAAFPDTRADWLGQRERRHAAFLALLRSGASAPRIEAQLYDWWWDLPRGYPPAYRVQRETFWRATADMVLEIDALLHPPQRRHLLDRLERFRDDFLRLSGEPPSGGGRNRFDFR